METATLAERLRQTLASAGGDGRLPSERVLADRLGVGRSQLRRALSELEARGQIFRRQGQGTFVAPPPAPGAEALRGLATAISPADVMEVRREIEPALAALAAARACDTDVASLKQLAMRGFSADDPGNYEFADEIFHHRIAEIAGNPLFLRIYQEIRAVRQMTHWYSERAQTLSPEQIADRSGEHLAIVDAIGSGKPDAAADAMGRHLLRVDETMRRCRS
ncbi:FadR family transcriptional regulator [Paracoccus suum]|uniref:FadR family transcriptional regulator n=1 Tax=Paracoccus suum TaxID=2259340 RepID=A0A344PKS1_9RHOB|nr:FCD domain-containing protein [Paracoccus suum]AXC49976.1 FadR family transcriptional regulator [Paracoccus suum]